MQTISWLLGIGMLALTFTFWYLRKWVVHSWDNMVERFYRKLMQEEDYAQRMIHWAKGLIRPFTGTVVVVFTALFLLMTVVNIVTIERSGALLLSFGQTLWAMFGVLQLVFWSLAEAAVYALSLIGMSRPVTTNPVEVVIFYEVAFSFVIGSLFWLFFPWEDKIGIKSESIGDVDEVAAAKTVNRRFRNFIRLVGIGILFTVLHVNDVFQNTMVPMWPNPGLERIGAIIGHYGEEALVVEVPVPESAQGPAPVTYGDYTKADQGWSWWVWLLIALGIIGAGVAFYFFILPRLRGKGGGAASSIMAEGENDFSRNDLDQPFQRLNAAKEPYYNFLMDAFMLSNGLKEGHVAEQYREVVQGAIDKLTVLVKALYDKLSTAKKPYPDFESDFVMVDLIVKNKLGGDLDFSLLTRKTLNTFIATTVHNLKQASRYSSWETDAAFIELALSKNGWIGDQYRDGIVQTLNDAKKRFSN